MRVVFAGAFPTDNASADVIPSAASERWQCHVCYSWNDSQLPASPDADDVQFEGDIDHRSCKNCRRPHHPPWLLLEDHAFQIQLGSLLLALTERQPPASRKVVAVVVGIDFSAKKLQLVAVAPRTRVKETVASPSHAGVIEDKPELRFREIELQYPWLDHARLEPFSSTTESDFEWAHSLSEYGICGTCRRVFHISQGDPKSKDANEELIRCYEAALEALRMRKQHQVRERKFTLVPDTTTEIRAAEQRIRHAKRQLEFLEPLSCPFCGWVESATSGSSSAKQTSGGVRTFG